MSSTHKSRITLRAPELSLGITTWPDCIALRRPLLQLQRHQPLADPEARPIRMGIEDSYGDLMHVVEARRLTEAVKVFELLSDAGLVPGHGRCRASDGRTLMQTCRWLTARHLAFTPMVPAGAQRVGSTVPSLVGV